MMTEQRDYLIKLDQQNGDGDLGISMENGFKAICESINDEKDLGRVFFNASKVFNEAAPSSLGTIISFGLMGIAKNLKGFTEASCQEFAVALDKGIQLIMEKAGSKPGEKTILDALVPGVEAMKKAIDEQCSVEGIFAKAAQASLEGAESTREMKSVHGRAAYYGDKSIGLLDGGAMAGAFIFSALLKYIKK